MEITLDETAETFGKKNQLTPKAIEELKTILKDAWQNGYDTSMMDDKDPELNIDKEAQALSDLMNRKPDA
jgi:hypothetical protein